MEEFKILNKSQKKINNEEEEEHISIEFNWENNQNNEIS